MFTTLPAEIVRRNWDSPAVLSKFSSIARIGIWRIPINSHSIVRTISPQPFGDATGIYRP